MKINKYKIILRCFLLIIFILTCNNSTKIPGFHFSKINKQGYEEYMHDITGIVMVKLVGGEVNIGISEEEKSIHLSKLPVGYVPFNYGELKGRILMSRKNWEKHIQDEKPSHKVTLTPFLIAKYEVSQLEWKKIIGENPSHFKGDKLPVENVSWNDCQEFCNKTGLNLPTEAQWEYACRGGTNNLFTNGSSLKTNQSNFDPTEEPYKDQEDGIIRGNTVPVTSFQPNGYGLFNMHGNVAELCEDTYIEDFYSTIEATQINPIPTKIEENKVKRGGCFLSSAKACRSSNRDKINFNVRYGNVGFRPVYNLNINLKNDKKSK